MVAFPTYYVKSSRGNTFIKLEIKLSFGKLFKDSQHVKMLGSEAIAGGAP